MHFSLFLAVLLICASLVTAAPLSAYADDPPKDAADEVHLKLDTTKYEEMPKNFRKTTDLTVVEKDKGLNLKGLGTLNISGSSQFSGMNLPMLLKAIDTKLSITDIDLRQESHGFVNGLPISWANQKNNANMGLTRSQVLFQEIKDLASIPLNKPLTFYNHPKDTVIPTQVQNENKLADSKQINYLRVPVTDGKIPTDDMVDFFVDFVKGLPKDSWLHFHCKEGIGRTSTFMIMYDMMNNYQQVSADDIIKRQLALAQYSDQTVQSFYNPERIPFLKSFYQYCKENGKQFKTPFSEWKKNQKPTPAPSTSMNYVKNPIIPANLYVISQSNMTAAEKTMIASLQGAINPKSPTQIYMLDPAHPDYKVWLEDLQNRYGVSCKTFTDPWKLLSAFKGQVEGCVIYSSKDKNDPSINNACSLAALKNAIVVDESIMTKAAIFGPSKIVGDCRGTDAAWAFNNLWKNGLRHSLVIELAPDKASPLRDYAIMAKALVFYEDSAKDTTLRDKIFAAMPDNSLCLGWGPDEFNNVSTASRHGVSVVAADWTNNLTVLSAFPSEPLKQKASEAVPSEKDVHYVTFIMSDGDNQQWYMGNNFTSPKWYGAPQRGSFNMGWSISPSLYYLAPTVFYQYYNATAKGTANDYFVVPPSGNGYMFPSKYKKSALPSFIMELNNYMGKVDQRYVTVLDDGSFQDKRLWDSFTAAPAVQGLFYLDYKRHDSYQGQILWSNDKPVVACRDLLWEGLESEQQLVEQINERVRTGQTNITSPKGYSFVYVHAWSKTMENVQEAVTQLQQNPKVRIVTPQVFMELIKKNVRHL